MSDFAIKQIKEYLDEASYSESKLCELSALASEYEEKQKIKQTINQDKENEKKQKQLIKAINKTYRICRKHAKKGRRQCKIVLLRYDFLGLINIVGASCYKFDYIFVTDFIMNDMDILKNRIKEDLLFCCSDMYTNLDFPVLTISWRK